MKSRELTREEMLEDSRRIYSNLSKRLKRIQKIENAPEYALLRFRELQENSPRDIRKLNDKELRAYYRQLKYINSLKSASVKGALSVASKWSPVKEKLNSLSRDKEAKFWSVYGKLYEETGISNRFKYDVFENISARMMQGEDAEDILNSILELYKELKSENPEESEDDFSIRFSNELDQFLY